MSAVEDVLGCFANAGQLRLDIRPWLLMAIQFHGLDDEAQVEDMAEQVKQMGLELSALHRELFGELLDPLGGYPGWRALLGG